MSAFEFYFGYYGLILGLSVATIIAGLARSLNARRSVRLGLLTPMLATFLLVDIPGFWVYAWANQDNVQITWNALLGATLIGAAYYLAASMVFPSEGDVQPSLDDHYWAKKRWVIGAVIAASLMMIVPFWIANPPDLSRGAFWFSTGAFLIPTTALLFTRRRWMDLTLLGWLIAWYGWAGITA